MKVLAAIVVAFYIFLKWEDLALANENWTPEFEKFCKNYMKYVDKYQGINAGCCKPDHASNNLMKKGWKGETLLICDGEEIT
tara:strand:+ start:4366 stop:4611 length:246 start_codon:yes stop_codon:yes gene_type:complete